MPSENKSLNNNPQKPKNEPDSKTTGKTNPDYIPAKDKNPDDMEIIEN